MQKQSLTESHHGLDVQGKRYEVLPGEVGTCFGTDALSSLPRNVSRPSRAPTPSQSKPEQAVHVGCGYMKLGQ